MELMVKLQVPTPPHAPLQPENVEPEAAPAVSVIVVPAATVCVQAEPHEIPTGELVTVPAPVPFFEIESVIEAGAASNLALTVVFWFTVTTQLAELLHPPPLQPPKVEPVLAVAVSVTCVPGATDWVQVVPHAIPAGELATPPAPVPVLVTESVTEAEAVAEPLRLRETVSPPAVKFTLAAKVPAVVG